jgi:hypothetical protein
MKTHEIQPFCKKERSDDLEALPLCARVVQENEQHRLQKAPHGVAGIETARWIWILSSLRSKDDYEELLRYLHEQC